MGRPGSSGSSSRFRQSGGPLWETGTARLFSCRSSTSCFWGLVLRGCTSVRLTLSSVFSSGCNVLPLFTTGKWGLTGGMRGRNSGRRVFGSGVMRSGNLFDLCSGLLLRLQQKRSYRFFGLKCGVEWIERSSFPASDEGLRFIFRW